MRFYVGLSKRIPIKKIIEFLGFLFVAAMAFFGIDKIVGHAATLNTLASDWTYNYWAGSDYDDSTTDIVNTSSPSGYIRPDDAWFGYIADIGRYSQRGQYVTGTKGYMCSRGEKATVSLRIGLTTLGFTNYPPTRVTMNNGGNTTNCTYTISNDGYYLETTCESVVNSTTNLIGFGLEVNGSSFNQSSKGFFIIPTSISYECSDATNSDAIIDNANQNTQDIIDNQNDNTDAIIDNQNQNTQDIIDNQNDNTDAIIDNQNENTEKEIESQLVCNSTLIDSSFIIINDTFFNSEGVLRPSSSGFGVTDFIAISGDRFQILNSYGSSPSMCFYDSSKTLISCISYSNFPEGTSPLYSIPSNTAYARFSINSTLNRPSFKVNLCKNGNQAITDAISSDDVSSATDTGTSFFGDTSVNDHGISAIVTAPIRLLQAIINSNDSCTNLPLSIDMGGTFQKNVSVPSGCILWDNVPSAVSAIYITMIFGLLIYYVLVDLFHFVDDLHDPDKKNSYTLDL